MPPRLYLMAIDSTGTETFPADSQLSSGYYGGLYNATTATYSFNVWFYVFVFAFHTVLLVVFAFW